MMFVEVESGHCRELRELLKNEHLEDDNLVVLRTSESGGPMSFRSKCEAPDGARVEMIETVSYDEDGEEDGWRTISSENDDDGGWALVISVD